MTLNEKEKVVLDLIRSNPYLTQQEMANELEIPRPTLANVISSLMKRGKIAGRAYILSDEKEVVCIGGANIDRKFHLKESTQLGTSNPANMTVSVGGVARNIAENLGRLSHNVRLLTVAGNDTDWEKIVQQSSAFMNVTDAGILFGQSTGSYSAVLDPNGELVIAMANMGVYDLLSTDYIEDKSRVLSNSSMLVIDLNCPKETVTAVKVVAQNNQIPLTIIPVSSPKMNRMPDDLEGVTWFICNRDEAEAYTGQVIENDDDWQEAVYKLLDFGAENVIVTRGAKGVMAASIGTAAVRFKAIEPMYIEDVTGAGDAFVAGVLHGYLQGADLEESILMGLHNAAKTLECSFTVRPDLTNDRLTIEMEDYK
ncbi:carbohydrate kinase [Sporosarcina quadrami]|uniref:carbohydrate kinase n=1 Tax=Sporosarcina quadrami TaxID=2762234 RepID=UPI00296AC496|nr:carbohydrate kinase [Sporosarcina quadrami]